MWTHPPASPPRRRSLPSWCHSWCQRLWRCWGMEWAAARPVVVAGGGRCLGRPQRTGPRRLCRQSPCRWRRRLPPSEATLTLETKGSFGGDFRGQRLGRRRLGDEGGTPVVVISEMTQKHRARQVVLPSAYRQHRQHRRQGCCADLANAVSRVPQRKQHL